MPEQPETFMRRTRRVRIGQPTAAAANQAWIEGLLAASAGRARKLGMEYDEAD